MSEALSNGVDEQGFVGCNIATENVEGAFQPALDDAVAGLHRILGTQCHSIYLYGSVGRGTAVYGVSDLDLSVIVEPALSTNQLQTLNELADDICKRHASISKLEFDVGDYDEAMVRNEFEWQFWLKHLCVCVWGEDLRPNIEPYRPSTAVGVEMNKDLKSRLDSCYDSMTAENYLPHSKSIAKKILRTQYSLVCEADHSYFDNLEQIVDVLVKIDPQNQPFIKQLLVISRGSDHSLGEIQGLIKGYGRSVLNNLDRMRDNLIAR